MGIRGFTGFGGGATALGMTAGGGGPGISATGGIICDYESPTSPGTFYRCHVFNATGSLVVSDTGGLGAEAEVVVIGGGGDNLFSKFHGITGNFPKKHGITNSPEFCVLLHF